MSQSSSPSVRLRLTWHACAGIACGIAIWSLFTFLRPAAPPAVAEPQGTILSECDGTLGTLVIQYVPEATFVETTYRQFLPQLPHNVTVYVACPNVQAYQTFLARVGSTTCTLKPVIAHHAMTTWSRDRWVPLADSASGKATLLAPREESGAEIWPARAGDAQIAFTLASVLPTLATAARSSLYFDGGDLLADSQRVFVTPAVVRRNLQHTVPSLDALRASLEAQLHRNVVILQNAPDHHVGMFMVIAAPQHAIVGDPSLARPLWESQDLWPERLDKTQWQPDFSSTTQEAFDAVAAQLSQLGYHVTRIPTIPGISSKAYLTYVNVLIDNPDNHRVVYMPIYNGVGPLNDLAIQIWTKLGYEVHPVDCTEVFPRFGTLHCLVNVVHRK